MRTYLAADKTENSFYMSSTSSMDSRMALSQLDQSGADFGADAQSRADVKIAFRLQERESMDTASLQGACTLEKAHGCVDELGFKVKPA